MTILHVERHPAACPTRRQVQALHGDRPDGCEIGRGRLRRHAAHRTHGKRHRTRRTSGRTTRRTDERERHRRRTGRERGRHRANGCAAAGDRDGRNAPRAARSPWWSYRNRPDAPTGSHTSQVTGRTAAPTSGSAQYARQATQDTAHVGTDNVPDGRARTPQATNRPRTWTTQGERLRRRRRSGRTERATGRTFAGDRTRKAAHDIRHGRTRRQVHTLHGDGPHGCEIGPHGCADKDTPRGRGGIGGRLRAPTLFYKCIRIQHGLMLKHFNLFTHTRK